MNAHGDVVVPAAAIQRAQRDMGKRAPARPMTGFAKITFGPDGQAEPVACNACGKSRCFCVRDMAGSIHRWEAADVPAQAASETSEPVKPLTWKKAIRQELKAAGGGLRLKTLRRAVLKAMDSTDVTLTDAERRTKFRSKLKTIRGITRDGRMITLTATASQATADTKATAAAVAATDPKATVREQGEPAAGHGQGSSAPSVVTLRSDDDWFMMLQASMDMPAVVKFTATWCGPCHTIAPQFAALCAEHSTLLFVAVDVDEMEEVAEAAGVASMPAFQVYRRGERVEALSGANPAELAALVDRALLLS